MRSADFKTMSSEARDDLQSDEFAYIDPEGGKHLPIHDETHLRNAIARLGQPKTLRKFLSEGAKRTLQKNLKAKLARAQHTAAPTASRYRDIALDVATFRLKEPPVREGDALVYRPAKVFRAGDYPDKNFSLTPTELRAAAAKFDQPINVDLEHTATPLDGHLGKLVAVEASDDGSKLQGILAVPRWLNDILPNAKLSATWDRASKTLVGLALVRNPRVSDAALFTAFSVDQVLHGKQNVEDLAKLEVLFQDEEDEADDEESVTATIATAASAAEAAGFADSDGDDDDDSDSGDDDSDDKKKPAFLQKGKKGKKKDDKGKFSDSEEEETAEESAESAEKESEFAATGNTKSATALAQQVHDIAAGRGAICRMEKQPGKLGPHGIVKFADKGIQAIHDAAVGMGAQCSTLYGQRDLPGAGKRWQWQYPGIVSDGRNSVPGSTKASHFSDPKEGKDMGSKLARFLAELDETDEEQRTPAGFSYAGSGSRSRTPQTDNERILSERAAQLQEENRVMRQQGIYDRAVHFADKAIAEGHALPVAREGLVTLHMQAGNDDTFVGTASFSDGQSRVSQFEAFIMSQPKHLMDVEAAGAAMAEATAMFNKMRTTSTGTAEGGTMSAERRAHLLNLTNVGKQVVIDEKRNGSGRAN